jgi:hypothetical protein
MRLEKLHLDCASSAPPHHGPEEQRAEREKNEQIPLFFPRPAELRAVAGFTPCHHIGRKSSCYTFRVEYKLSPRTRPAGLQRSRGPLGKCSSCDATEAHNSGLYSIGKIVCRDFSEPARADSDRRRHASRNNHDVIRQFQLI